jgi:hypothetical protein
MQAHLSGKPKVLVNVSIEFAARVPSMYFLVVAVEDLR